MIGASVGCYLVHGFEYTDVCWYDIYLASLRYLFDIIGCHYSN